MKSDFRPGGRDGGDGNTGSPVGGHLNNDAGKVLPGFLGADGGGGFAGIEGWGRNKVL